MMYYYNDFTPYHMFGFGPIFMILFWGCVVYGFVLLFRQGKGSNQHTSHGGHSNALEVLKERYAKGEITKEEFISMKKDIIE